ncbi:MAG: hypothetical protein N2971_06695 [Chlorobi bacterium]|nr:hypothetical protein [Chlorobiota bacterium]
MSTRSSSNLSWATLEQLRAICRRHNAELLDYSFRGHVSARILELFIDSVENVSHELCEAISRDVEEYIESIPELSGIARLDVSSPGVDRPLMYSWQYPKHIGRLIRIRTSDGEEYTGRLRSASETAVVLDCNGNIVTIPFSAIQTAHVVLEW